MKNPHRLEETLRSREAELVNLLARISHADCSGKVFSKAEDVRMMERREELEEEIKELRKQIAEIQSAGPSSS